MRRPSSPDPVTTTQRSPSRRTAFAKPTAQRGRLCGSPTKLTIVDFHMSPGPGIEAFAASRVVPNGNGAEYLFTQFQAPGMSDETFTTSVQALAHEPTVLKCSPFKTPCFAFHCA